MNKTIETSIQQFFKDSTNPVLFAGAGVSTIANLPDWKNLLLQAAESIRAQDALSAQLIKESVAKGRLTKAAGYFFMSEDILEGEKYRIIKQLLKGYNSKPLEPLASLPFKSIITTNFDRALLDAVAASKGKSAIDYKYGDSSFTSANWETDFYIARIHGAIEVPNQMILSENHFSNLLQDDKYLDLLSSIFTQKQVLFLGFSFYDPAIKHVFEVIDKKFGPQTPGRHMAILPETNESEFLAKATRLNIQVVRYSPENKHKELWDGIQNYAFLLSNNNQVDTKETNIANHPYSATKKYLATCYARLKISTVETPLNLVVVEGIISAVLQELYPNSISLKLLQEKIRVILGLKAEEIEELIKFSLEQLIDSKLILKHKESKTEGGKYRWKAQPEPENNLESAIEKLALNTFHRAQIQFGWTPSKHAVDGINFVLRTIIFQRGWDLGAAFASGRSPDTSSLSKVMDEFQPKLPAFDRERLSLVIDSLLQHPTEDEAELLGELGRTSFALELAFQAPRTSLLHEATLPRKVYFDANILLPILVEGHPHFIAYNDTLDGLRKASAKTGTTTKFIALGTYLNEIISHRNSALEQAREAGPDFDVLVKREALYHGAGNINVYIGAYANALENNTTKDFSSFMKKVAPYTNEKELIKYVEKKGIIVLRVEKVTPYSDIYHLLEKANSQKLANGKLPILVDHDALQLAQMSKDAESQEKALFVTADRQLYDDLNNSKYSHLREFMVSNVGLVQLVDLLVGLKSSSKAVGQLLWSGHVSERTQKIRSYLTLEALRRYDAALGMSMHAIVEAHAEDTAKTLERGGLDLETGIVKKRVDAFRSLGTLEANFFSKLANATQKKK